MASKRKLRDRPDKTPSSTPTKRQKRPTNFFDLPQEIRDRIYHFIWDTKCGFLHTYKNLLFKFHYSEDYSIIDDIPNSESEYWGLARKRPWYLVSKHFCSEAIEQFHCGATVEYMWDKPDAITENMSSSSSSGRKLLLSPWKCRTLDLGVITLREQFGLADNGRDAISTIQIRREEPLLRLRSSAGLTGSANVRVMKMQLDIRVNEHMIADLVGTVEVELGALAALDLSSLNMVEMKVGYYSRDGVEERMMEEVVEGIKEMGSFLVGGSATEVLEETHVGIRVVCGSEEIPQEELLWKVKFIRDGQVL
jgi:hypothetical protein